MTHAFWTRLLERYYKPWSERRHQNAWYNMHLQALLKEIRVYGRSGLYKATLDLPGPAVDHLTKLLHHKGYSVAVTGMGSAGYHLVINY